MSRKTVISFHAIMAEFAGSSLVGGRKAAVIQPDRGQRGFSLVMAVFLVVVLGGIAVFLGRVASMQYQQSALDEEGALAYQAARAGVEWGAYQALQAASCAPSTNLTFDPGTALAGYGATVTCTAATAYEGVTPVNLYRITSTASNGNPPTGNYYVERQLQVTVAR